MKEKQHSSGSRSNFRHSKQRAMLSLASRRSSPQHDTSLPSCSKINLASSSSQPPPPPHDLCLCAVGREWYVIGECADSCVSFGGALGRL